MIAPYFSLWSQLLQSISVSPKSTVQARQLACEGETCGISCTEAELVGALALAETRALAGRAESHAQSVMPRYAAEITPHATKAITSNAKRCQREIASSGPRSMTKLLSLLRSSDETAYCAAAADGDDTIDSLGWKAER